jgi:C4-dicarboxylate-binding protein DctP
MSYHAHLQYAVIVNSKYWTGLPADIRGPLDKAMAEATDYTNQIAVQENDDALKAIKDSGRSELHQLTAEQRKAWQVAMQPTWQWAEGRVGKEVIGIMQKAASS